MDSLSVDTVVNLSHTFKYAASGDLVNLMATLTTMLIGWVLFVIIYWLLERDVCRRELVMMGFFTSMRVLQYFVMMPSWIYSTISLVVILYLYVNLQVNGSYVRKWPHAVGEWMDRIVWQPRWSLRKKI